MTKRLKLSLTLTSLLILCACSSTPKVDIGGAIPRDELPSPYGNPSSYKALGKTYYVLSESKGYKEKGLASWYGPNFHTKRTSSGTPYDMHAYSAAHKSLPIPTYVRVTNLDNQKSLILRIDDRGPFKAGRIIDLSYAAAKDLGVIAKGTAPVEVEAIEPYQSLSRPRKAPSKESIAAAPIYDQEKYVYGANTKTNNALTANHTTTDVTKNTNIDPQAFTTLPTNVTVQPLSEASLTGNYFLQLGAFSNNNNANILANKVRQSNQSNVQIREKDGFFRVLAGPYNDMQQAEEMRSYFSSLGIESSKAIVY